MAKQQIQDGTTKRRQKGSRVPDGESREQAFVRLARQRVTGLIAKYKHICNLGDYPHTAEQSEQIVAALQDGVDAVKHALTKGSAGAEGFKFSGNGQ